MPPIDLDGNRPTENQAYVVDPDRVPDPCRVNSLKFGLRMAVQRSDGASNDIRGVAVLDCLVDSSRGDV